MILIETILVSSPNHTVDHKKVPKGNENVTIQDKLLLVNGGASFQVLLWRYCVQHYTGDLLDMLFCRLLFYIRTLLGYFFMSI